MDGRSREKINCYYPTKILFYTISFLFKGSHSLSSGEGWACLPVGRVRLYVTSQVRKLLLKINP